MLPMEEEPFKHEPSHLHPSMIIKAKPQREGSGLKDSTCSKIIQVEKRSSTKRSLTPLIFHSRVMAMWDAVFLGESEVNGLYVFMKHAHLHC